MPETDPYLRKELKDKINQLSQSRTSQYARAYKEAKTEIKMDELRIQKEEEDKKLEVKKEKERERQRKRKKAKRMAKNNVSETE